MKPEIEARMAKQAARYGREHGRRDRESGEFNPIFWLADPIDYLTVAYVKAYMGTRLQ